MTITLGGLTRSMLLVSAFLVASLPLSGGNLVFDEALANNAGGNGNGKGQGAANAGNNGNGAGGASAANSNASGGNSSDTRRINAVLYASTNALLGASENSVLGWARQYAAALNGALQTQATLAADPNAVVDPNAPTLDDAAAILDGLANNFDVTPELVNQVNTRLAEAGLIDPALVASATTTQTDPNAPVQPTLAEQIATLANADTTENNGLGPIY
jgi:hypothetical protein